MLLWVHVPHLPSPALQGIQCSRGQGFLQLLEPSLYWSWVPGSSSILTALLLTFLRLFSVSLRALQSSLPLVLGTIIIASIHLLLLLGLYTGFDFFLSDLWSWLLFWLNMTLFHHRVFFTHSIESSWFLILNLSLIWICEFSQNCSNPCNSNFSHFFQDHIHLASFSHWRHQELLWILHFFGQGTSCQASCTLPALGC